MNHPDKYQAKRYDTAGRCAEFTDIVYGECFDDADQLKAAMRASTHKFDPPAPTLKVFVGEMHGHTNLSDGKPDIDTYFRNIRDIAQLDFAALSDHDHGGVGRPTLWAGSPSKWDLIREKVKEYNAPGTFSTLLAYERDSYPFYNNMVVYFRDHDAELIRGERDGELTETELRAPRPRGCHRRPPRYLLFLIECGFPCYGSRSDPPDDRDLLPRRRSRVYGQSCQRLCHLL